MSEKCPETFVFPSEQFWKIFGNLQKVVGNLHELNTQRKIHIHAWLCNILYLLHRHECFTGEYVTCKIYTKLHPGLEWRIFCIFTSEDIDDCIDLTYVAWCTIETSSGLPLTRHEKLDLLHI